MTWTLPWRVQLVVLAPAVCLVISLGPQGKQDAILPAEEVAFGQHSWLRPCHKQHNINAFGKWEEGPFFCSRQVCMLPPLSGLPESRLSQGGLYHSMYLFTEQHLFPYFRELLELVLIGRCLVDSWTSQKSFFDKHTYYPSCGGSYCPGAGSPGTGWLYPGSCFCHTMYGDYGSHVGLH